jgi:hypothetical protein
MDVFDKIGAATPTEFGTFLQRDGKYLLAVEKVMKSQKSGGEFFIAEFRVIESAKDPNYPDTEPHSPGAQVTFITNLTTNKAAASNVQGFLRGLLGVETVDSATARVCCGQDNPCRGIVVRMATSRGTIKSGPNAGNPILRFNWEHVPQDQSAITAMCHRLDNGEPVPAVHQAAAVAVPVAQPAPTPAGGFLSALKR